MKTSTKTLLVSALALACSGGVYAQSAGGSAGGVQGGGNAPDGNTLNQPSVQPGTTGNTGTYDDGQTMRSQGNTGGYGNPGTTGTNSGRSTVSPGMNQDPSGTTGGYSPQQDQTYDGGH